MTEDSRLWFCGTCGFYHLLSESCPKTGKKYDVFLRNSESNKGVKIENGQR